MCFLQWHLPHIDIWLAKPRLQSIVPTVDGPQLNYMLSPFSQLPVASFNKEVNPGLAKRPLETNGRLANRKLTSFVKETTGD